MTRPHIQERLRARDARLREGLASGRITFEPPRVDLPGSERDTRPWAGITLDGTETAKMLAGLVEIAMEWEMSIISGHKVWLLRPDYSDLSYHQLAVRTLWWLYLEADQRERGAPPI